MPSYMVNNLLAERAAVKIFNLVEVILHSHRDAENRTLMCDTIDLEVTTSQEGGIAQECLGL